MVCLMLSLPWQALNNLLCPLPCFFIPLPSSSLYSNHLSSLSPDVFTSLTSLKSLDFPPHLIGFETISSSSCFFLFTPTPSHSFHLGYLIIWPPFFHFIPHLPLISFSLPFHILSSLYNNRLVSLPSGLLSNLNKLNSLSFPFINPHFQWCSFPLFINQFPLSFNLAPTPSHPSLLEYLIICPPFLNFIPHLPLISFSLPFHILSSLHNNRLVSLPSGLFSNLNKLTSLSFPFINSPFYWTSSSLMVFTTIPSAPSLLMFSMDSTVCLGC